MPKENHFLSDSSLSRRHFLQLRGAAALGMEYLVKAQYSAQGRISIS